MRRGFRLALPLLLSPLLCFPCPAAEPSTGKASLRPIPATEPAQAPQTLRLQNGFRAELVAAEPLVTDPIAMQCDENGLLYVVEMNDYPYSDKSKDQAWEEQTSAPIGRIRVLEDTNGDGRMDKSTVFADKLSWPAGVALWKGGVYVAATPDVLYLKDTDGDRKADVRRKVLTGFRKYNVQAVMNGFHWGLDHRIYAAGSSNGGDIAPEADPQSKPVRLGRNDFRFDPRSERFEIISGGARFGNTFDDWGNRFLCNIRNPVQHIVLPARYLKRNRYLPVRSALNDVATSGDAIAVYPISPPEAWRVINAQRQAAAVASKPPFDSTVAKGYITSSSGVTIYRGAAYPKEFQGNAFIGEVAGNLTMRYRLKPAGVSFAGTRAHKNIEFLASTDNWFRPVNFFNAPDGTLYVLDMYRETIEHPWSMPDDLKAHVDLTSGRDRGRIYRLVPPKYADGFQQPPQPRLGDASIAELVAQLENPNSWWRETAHRLIFERQSQDAVAPLTQLLRSSSQPLARLHALWSLHGLEALTDELLLRALSGRDTHVREHAVRLAEPRLVTSRPLLERVLAAASDEGPRVRFQVALTLGETKDPRAVDALAQIARSDGDDPWTRTAVLSSVADSTGPFLLRILQDREFVASPQGRPLVQLLANIIGTRNQPQAVQSVLQACVAIQPVDSQIEDRPLASTQVALLEGLGTGLKRARTSLVAYSKQEGTAESLLIQTLLSQARQTVLDGDAAIAARLQALRLVGFDDYQRARNVLVELLDARQPQEVQLAAVTALASFAQPEVGDLLLERYSSLTPGVRSGVVRTLLTRSGWLVGLLDAIRGTRLAGSPNPTNEKHE